MIYEFPRTLTVEPSDGKTLLTIGEVFAAFDGACRIAGPLLRYNGAIFNPRQQAGRAVVSTHSWHPYTFAEIELGAFSTDVSNRAALPATTYVGQVDVPPPQNECNGVYSVLERPGGDYWASYGLYYAVSGVDIATLTTWDRQSGQQSTPCRVPAHHNASKGQLGYSPDNQYLIGGSSGSPGHQTTSWAPCMWRVPVDAQPQSEAYPGEVLSFRPYGNPLVTSLFTWNEVTTSLGGAWIDTGDKHGVLFLGGTGDEPIWYGDGTYTDPQGNVWRDPLSNDKGYHSSRYWLWAAMYDPADWGGDPTTVEPVEVADLSQIFTPFANSENPRQAPTVCYRHGHVWMVEPSAYSDGEPKSVIYRFTL